MRSNVILLTTATPLPTFSPSNTPTLTKATINYPVPSGWKRITTKYGLRLCLPPKWEVDEWGNVYFNRDSGYRPSVTYIQNLPYDGGSRRESFFKFWERDYPEVRKTVKVSEVNINGNSLLLFSGPVGEMVIWVAQGKLWQAGFSGWEWVNDSQTAFLKDFYTMIGCSS